MALLDNVLGNMYANNRMVSPGTTQGTFANTMAVPSGSTPNYTGNMGQDFLAYFAGTPAGTTQDWAQGTLSMGQGGNATYTPPSGSPMTFNAETPMSQLYQNPFIQNTWNQMYGTEDVNQALGGNNFNIPTNLYSTSGSTSQNQSNQQSGIDWNTPFMQQILPSLTGAATNLQPNVDAMKQTLQDQYSNMMREALGPGALQGTLNQLAGRNMLNSQVASDALRGVSRDIMKDVANRGYESLLAQQAAQMEVPSILGNLAELGRRSTGTSTGTSTSSTQNPLEPYQLMAQLMMY